MNKLHALEMLVIVGKQGSFASAAQLLGMNPSTISKGIERLEKEVGVRLFQRTTRSICLTTAGKKYYDIAEKVLSELRACEAELAGDILQPKGVLKVNAPASYGRLYISPMIKTFYEKYPSIDLELTFEDSFIDSIHQGFDLSVRTGKLQDNRFIVQQLSAMTIITVAAPALAHSLDRPFIAKDFINHAWIRYRFKQSGRLLPVYTLTEGKIDSHNPNQKIVMDDGEAIVDMCCDGLGLTQLPHFMLRRALSQKLLVPVMPTFTMPEAGIFITYPKRNFQPTRVQVFIDHMKVSVRELGESSQSTWADYLEPLKFCDFT